MNPEWLSSGDPPDRDSERVDERGVSIYLHGSSRMTSLGGRSLLAAFMILGDTLLTGTGFDLDWCRRGLPAWDAGRELARSRCG